MTAHTHQFQAEVSQVLSLVVNSLYSHKEIFLRELVSNASDALDKLRFKALQEDGLSVDTEELHIKLIPDEAAGTLTIEDNGIGMTEDELIENLGTIARSGTREFAERLQEVSEAKEGNAQLIGQFGVGFYSAFLVADRVTVTSRAIDANKAYRWESEAHDAFTIEPAERDERGTTIVLHLKDEHRGFSTAATVREVIRKHSDYVGHPIELVSEGEKKDEESDAEPSIEVINQASALWQRSPAEVEDAQYIEFYKHLAHDWEDPLAWKHFRIEGTQMFSGIVFLPATTRPDLIDPQGEHGVRLHVRRVLAMESCEELLPKWLRFVRGVIDSEDLPLNVSRETLQDSRAVRIIQKQVVSQVLAMIEELEKERPEDYLKFWDGFGAVLKEGLYFDPALQERLAALARFKTTAPVGAESDGWTRLADYVSRMKEGQPGIYYVQGESQQVMQSSPHLEQLLSKGFEVLFMTDGVDPFALEKLTEFDGHKLLNAMGEKLDLGEGPTSEASSTDELTAAFEAVLGDKVSAVRNSERLAESPACLVTPEGGLPPHLEAMFKAQNLDIPKTSRVLEVNPDHPVVQNLRKLQLLDANSSQFGDWVQVLYDQALIAEGSQVAEPAALAKRLTSLLARASELAVGEKSSD